MKTCWQERRQIHIERLPQDELTEQLATDGSKTNPCPFMARINVVTGYIRLLPNDRQVVRGEGTEPNVGAQSMRVSQDGEVAHSSPYNRLYHRHLNGGIEADQLAAASQQDGAAFRPLND